MVGPEIGAAIAKTAPTVVDKFFDFLKLMFGARQQAKATEFDMQAVAEGLPRIAAAMEEAARTGNFALTYEGHGFKVSQNHQGQRQELGLSERAALLDFNQRVFEQKNIESTLDKAHAKLTEGEPIVNDEPVRQSFVYDAVDAVKHVDDEDLQLVWASLIAAEFVSPGKTRKSTLETLKKMDRHDAELFIRVVQHTVGVMNNYGVLLDTTHTPVKTLAYTDVLRAIELDLLSSQVSTAHVDVPRADIMIVLPIGSDHHYGIQYPTGLQRIRMHFLTSAGRQLLSLVEPKQDDVIALSAIEPLKEYGVTIWKTAESKRIDANTFELKSPFTKVFGPRDSPTADQ